VRIRALCLEWLRALGDAALETARALAASGVEAAGARKSADASAAELRRLLLHQARATMRELLPLVCMQREAHALAPLPPPQRDELLHIPYATGTALRPPPPPQQQQQPQHGAADARAPKLIASLREPYAAPARPIDRPLLALWHRLLRVLDDLPLPTAAERGALRWMEDESPWAKDSESASAAQAAAEAARAFWGEGIAPSDCL
jgi:hypothetical protein